MPGVNGFIVTDVVVTGPVSFSITSNKVNIRECNDEGCTSKATVSYPFFPDPDARNVTASQQFSFQSGIPFRSGLRVETSEASGGTLITLTGYTY